MDILKHSQVKVILLLTLKPNIHIRVNYPWIGRGGRVAALSSFQSTRKKPLETQMRFKRAIQDSLTHTRISTDI